MQSETAGAALRRDRPAHDKGSRRKAAPTAMRSALTIARAEWRLHTRRRSFWLLLALFTTLLLVAATLNRSRQLRDRAQQTAYQQLVRAQWEGQPERHPHRVAHYGTFAFKPPGPMAAFDSGVESYAGRVLYLEAHRQNATNFAEASELSSAFRLGELSPAFLLQTLLPLIVIVLGYRSVVDEAESGRLRLLLAQGVSSRALVVGKFLGLGVALVPFVVTGAIISLATLLTDPAFRGDEDAAVRVAILATALGLHTLAWLGLSIGVSAGARNAVNACGTLVALWILATVVAPRAAAVVASSRHPLPDKSSFAAAVAEDVRSHGDSHDPNDPNFARFRAETLAKYGASRVEDLPVNYGAIVMARGEELAAETFARHFAALAEQMEAQAAAIRTVSLLAPSLAVRTLSAAAAGTDLRAQLDFERRAEAYRYEFVQQLNELHRDKVAYKNDRDQKLAPEHWKQFRDFQALPPSLGESLRGTALSWLALLLWALVPLAVLFRARPAIA
jgi:ABC-2 type transport system permease protein